MHIPRVAISTVFSLVVWGVTPVKMGNAQSIHTQKHPNPINIDDSDKLDISPHTKRELERGDSGILAKELITQLPQVTVTQETPHILPSEEQYQAVYDGDFLRMSDVSNPASTPASALNLQQSINSEPVILPDSIAENEFIVKDVEIRFVNNKGESVDKDGNPIQGRIPREYIANEIQLKPGDVLTQAVIRRDLQQLQQLGLFERVDVSVVPADEGVNVIYNIQQRPARSINPGGGYNDDVGVYGTLSYRDFKLLPNPQRVEGNTQISLNNVDFNAQYVSPYQAANDSLGYSFSVFRKRTTSNIFDREIDLLSGERVRELRSGARAAVTRPIGEWWGTVGLNFTRLSTRDRDGRIAREDELGNPLTFSGTGIDDLYTVSLGVTRDWRDNPFNPKQGSILSLSTEQSIPIGVGNILQNRLVGNYIQYVPVRWLSSEAQNAQRDVFPEMFAFNLQAGAVIGEMSPTQAFRLGGINSVRGYEEGNLGSGRSYILATGEYRFPVFSGVGGVIFADFASDLGTGNSVVGEPAVVRNKPGTGFGTGVGARWRSPFGILRVDLGVNDQGEVRFYTELGTGTRF
ncbi:BamA/TamA family outer membrane protein [Microcoleus sp. FACHB-53]|nr:BamA/TamA family outer membrane protein [Microcoleus sp. FACHB-53]